MNWGAIDYSKPDTQMRLIKQFEDVVATSNVGEVDTKRLWLADFALWTTYQCTENFDREIPENLECGHDQIFLDDNSTCAGTWKPNIYGLREKVFADLDTCVAFEGGICRPMKEMHPNDLEGVDVDTTSEELWCPVFEGWGEAKMSFCLRKWREITGGSGRLVLEDDGGTPTECAGEFNKDETVLVPIPYSAGPTMFAFGLFSHEITLDMIEETRAVCDDDPEIHCWLTGACLFVLEVLFCIIQVSHATLSNSHLFSTGIPYDYWSQYIDIYSTFFEIAGISVAVGFGVSFLFLLVKLLSEKHHSLSKIVVGSLVGSFLIAVTTILSLVAVSGLSVLFDVPFTGFSTMSFVLSVGFAVEYSVHVVARWLRARSDLTTSIDRVEYTMSFLMLPTFMSFVSSTIGVVCLAFTEFEFNHVFFFRPLIIVMFVTYFYGCWWLPVCLTLLDFDQVKLGAPIQETEVLSGHEKPMHFSRKEEEEKQEEEEEVVDAEFEDSA
jgi:hypothetical protein